MNATQVQSTQESLQVLVNLIRLSSVGGPFGVRTAQHILSNVSTDKARYSYSVSSIVILNCSLRRNGADVGYSYIDWLI